MSELIVWVFLAIIQVEGGHVGVYSDALACHEALQQVRQLPDTLLITPECVQVKMVKP